MKFMPCPSRLMIEKLDQLSFELGWGKLRAEMIPFGNGTTPCPLWESEKWRDMRLTICAIQKNLTRDQVVRRVATFSKFQACVVTWEFGIYAGPVRFSLPHSPA